MEYDDDYDNLSGNPNGLANSWSDSANDVGPHKSFHQRRRLDIYPDRAENGVGNSHKGNSLGLEDGPSIQQYSPAWGQILNGHLSKTDKHDSKEAVPDSWEALASEKTNVDR